MGKEDLYVCLKKVLNSGGALLKWMPQKFVLFSSWSHSVGTAALWRPWASSLQLFLLVKLIFQSYTLSQFLFIF